MFAGGSEGGHQSDCTSIKRAVEHITAKTIGQYQSTNQSINQSKSHWGVNRVGWQDGLD